MARIRITIENKVVERELSGPVTAGRNPGLDLPLPVKEASREHFRIGRLKDGGWAVHDLGSTNGTFVNGERVRAAPLKHNDRIQVGRSCSVVFVDPPAPQPGRARPRKPAGPIVLKTRAQRLKEKQEEEARKRREERKAARAAAAQQEEQPDAETATELAAEEGAEPLPGPEQEEAKPDAGAVPENAIEIDSEATLQKLLAQGEEFDRLVESGRQPVVFGDYTIQARLSEGGMGVVFKAHNRKRKLDVALKLLKSEMVDAENIARFKQEAWAISAFNHPNIVKVRELARHAGMHYIAMDFIDGEDLLALGFRQELTFWQQMEAIDKLADVLRLVHARNIWHRDIKPQNVLMDRKGEIKLIDFGIATVEREQDDAAQTAEGLIMGTPAFLSPEQAARGKMGAIDGRADLYSLGAVMYYLLTGRRPFTGKSAIEILTRNMKVPPPHPHKVDPMIPAGLVRICLKLLEKQPDDRFQSASALQEVLAQWRKSKDGRKELDRHRKILKLRERKKKAAQKRA